MPMCFMRLHFRKHAVSLFMQSSLPMQRSLLHEEVPAHAELPLKGA